MLAGGFCCFCNANSISTLVASVCCRSKVCNAWVSVVVFVVVTTVG